MFISPFPVFISNTGQWFSAFSPHGTHKLITKILQHTKKKVPTLVPKWPTFMQIRNPNFHNLIGFL